MKKILLYIFFLTLGIENILAQQCLTTGGCSNFNNQYPSGILSLTSSWTTKSGMNGGNYTLFSVICGNRYGWTYCPDHTGVPLNWDPQLTLYNESNLSTPICFSTDVCGLAPYIEWTATFTGTVRLLTSEYITNVGGCKTNAPNPPYNTLAYIQSIDCSGSAGWYTTPTSPVNISSSGGSNSFGVNTTSGGCTYSAVSNNSWINNIVQNSGTITYNVDVNSSSARNGTISIKNSCGVTVLTFTINQAGVSCSSTLNSYSANLPSSTSSGNSFNVNTQSSCNWTANSNDGWITITSGSSGTGNGTVNYSVTSNGSTNSRSGTITAGGYTFTVNQMGVSCSSTLNSYSANLPSSASSGNSFNVNTQSGCNWTANSNDGWITITFGSSGTGNGTVNYSVTSNPNTSSRTGTITVAGQTFTVTQAAGTNPILPDLVIQNASSPYNVVAGSSVIVSYLVKNNGNGNATKSYVSFHLSSDNIFQSGVDPFIVDTLIPSIASTNSTQQMTQQVNIPANTATGVWYILISADGTNIINESDETNNTTYVPINVMPCYDETKDYYKLETNYYGTGDPAFSDCQNQFYSNSYDVDKWHFNTYQCVSYVAFMINKSWGYTFPTYKFCNASTSPALSNAGFWASRLGKIGYVVDNTPAIGSIAWYDVNSSIYTPPPGKGHVAFVNCISGGGNIITLTEYNGHGLDNQDRCLYGTRNIDLSLADASGNRIPTNFIHTEIGEIGGLGGDETSIFELLSGSENEIFIYPNPANENITIENGTLAKNKTISVYNIQGQLLIQQPMPQTRINIDISTFAKGMYFVEVKTETGFAVEKFVKE